MPIQVYERNVYGRQTIYPVGPEAGLLTALTKKKTLDLADVRHLQDLGLEVEFVPDPATHLSRGQQLTLNLQ
jgi:hypothetical protein